MNKRHSAILGLSAIAAILAAQPYRPVIVDGQSMAPTYEPGAFVLASRQIGDLHADDIVVIRHGGRAMIKRVAYLGGEHITQYKISDTWIEPGTSAAAKACVRARFPSRTIQIPTDHLYVLGDNDSESIDSRQFGPVRQSDVMMRVVEPRAKVELRFQIGGYPPRVLSGQPIVSMRTPSE